MSSKGEVVAKTKKEKKKLEYIILFYAKPWRVSAATPPGRYYSFANLKIPESKEKTGKDSLLPVNNVTEHCGRNL